MVSGECLIWGEGIIRYIPLYTSVYLELMQSEPSHRWLMGCWHWVYHINVVWCPEVIGVPQVQGFSGPYSLVWTCQGKVVAVFMVNHTVILHIQRRKELLIPIQDWPISCNHPNVQWSNLTHSQNFFKGDAHHSQASCTGEALYQHREGTYLHVSENGGRDRTLQMFFIKQK